MLYPWKNPSLTRERPTLTLEWRKTYVSLTYQMEKSNSYKKCFIFFQLKLICSSFQYIHWRSTVCSSLCVKKIFITVYLSSALQGLAGHVLRVLRWIKLSPCPPHALDAQKSLECNWKAVTIEEELESGWQQDSRTLGQEPQEEWPEGPF